MLFPAVRRAAPHLAAVVDRLEADHREVSATLDEIEALAHELDDAKARAALVEALTRLSGGLLEHLAYEEETIDSRPRRLGRVARLRSGTALGSAT